MQPKLYLMVGYPGAGKTTTAKAIQYLTGAVRLSSDELRLELFPQPSFSPQEHEQLYRELDNRTKALLASGKSVIYDANLNRQEHRQEKYALCTETGAQPVVMWVQTARELAKERATQSERAALIPQHESASQMFDRIAEIIEPPTAEERPILVDGTKITPEYIARTLDFA